MEDNLTDNMESNLIRRCCKCKAIILDGILTPNKGYSEKELEEKGFGFTDTFLSKECFKNFYPEIDSTDYKFDYESCKIQ